MLALTLMLMPVINDNALPSTKDIGGKHIGIVHQTLGQ